MANRFMLFYAPRCDDELASMDIEYIDEMAELTIQMCYASMHELANSITPTLVWTMRHLPWNGMIITTVAL